MEARGANNAAKYIKGNDAIYRISFWENQGEARADLAARGFCTPHVMMRVSRASVAKALEGWTFGDDDFLSQRAALIWQCRSRKGEIFCDQGIPVEQFEVWESNGWRPWTQAESLLPDRARLTRVGWQPLSVVTRQGPVIAYWCIVQLVPHDSDSQWVLLTLDNSYPGTLGGEYDAVNQVANLLLTNQLCMVAPFVGGILTVHADEDRLWTEQYEVSHSEDPSPSFFRRILQPQKTWKVECKHLLPPIQERALIRKSGLRAARPELRSSVW